MTDVQLTDTVYYRNASCAVTSYGMQPLCDCYPIEAGGLASVREESGFGDVYEIPVQLADKTEWVILEDLLDAFVKALHIHVGGAHEQPRSDESVMRTIAAARARRGEALRFKNELKAYQAEYQRAGVSLISIGEFIRL